MELRHLAWRVAYRTAYAALWAPAHLYKAVQNRQEQHRLGIEQDIQIARLKQDLLENRYGDWS